MAEFKYVNHPDLNRRIASFLETTGYDKSEKILAIVVYGSRVRNTYKETSDLDFFVIIEDCYNYKQGFVIDGVKIDCSIYSVHQIFSIAYQKRLANNVYFTSVLESGIVLKNKGNILGEFHNYLNELADLHNSKKKLSSLMQSEIKDLQESFIESRNPYFYYNLLEEIRKAYYFLKNYSYINWTKVYDVFTNKAFYKKTYHIEIPRENFTSLFLQGVVAQESNQIQIVDSLLSFLGNIEDESSYESLLCQMDVDSIQLELLALHNKVRKITALFACQHPYANYCYYVLLYQFRSFYQKVYGLEERKIAETIERKVDSFDKRDTLNDLFALIEKDYHFDYDHYMLKCKM